jgi:hypothetical protein
MDDSAFDQPYPGETIARAAEAAIALQEERVLMAQEERRQLEQSRAERRILLRVLLVFMAAAIALAIAELPDGAKAAGLAAGGVALLLRSQRATGPDP